MSKITPAEKITLGGSMKANSNITALKEAAEAQFKLNPDGALMLDPQFCLFCVEEYERSLTALLKELAKRG